MEIEVSSFIVGLIVGHALGLATLSIWVELKCMNERRGDQSKETTC